MDLCKASDKTHMKSLQQVTLPHVDNVAPETDFDVQKSDSNRDSASFAVKTCGDQPACKATECDISKPIPQNSDDCAETAEVQVSSKYYAVSFPSSLAALIDQDHPLIFQSKSDALQAIKKHPEARFREFNSRIDAVNYASVPLSTKTVLTLNETGEKTPFKSVTSQEMVQLRKAIESGNEGLFLERVWSNPRYLINSADGPTVMQEGTRYNALHVAARFKQAGMCLTILSVIHDKLFISALYPEDKPDMINERIKHLVDLYLNMPDKSLSETPVHFACKFGVDSILAILLSYPQCDINKLNKYGSSPKEVICDRHVCDSFDHKKRMCALFEDIFYVPVMRDETHNFIGQLCHANAVLAATSCSRNKESHVAYCAFAGPMSESDATKFCTLLKTKRFTEKADLLKVPFSPEEKTLLQICLSDSKKGLERIGRKLAKDLSTGWFEFWKPLDCWLDLSSEFGLDYLNNHLKKQNEMIDLEESGFPLPFNEFIISFFDDFIQMLPIILSNMGRMTFFHLFQTLVQHMCCFTKFTFSEEKEISLIHEEIGHLLYLKISTSNKNYFDALKFCLNIQSNVVGSMQEPKWKMFLCVLKFACHFQASNSVFMKSPVCDCDYVRGKYSYDYSSKSCYLSILSSRQQFTNYLSNTSRQDTERTSVREKSSVTGPSDNQTAPCETEETHMLMNSLSLDCKGTTINEKTGSDEAETLVSNSGIYHLIKKLRCIYEREQNTKVQENETNPARHEEEEEEEDEKFFTPPESPSNTSRMVFVHDQELSDDDIDIFRAIVDAGVRVSETKQPYAFKWKCLMESTLGPVLKPGDKISCTPTSSSASVRRAVTPIRDSLKRTLF